MIDIETRLKSLPDSPGVYIMKGGNNSILYVGKAKNLKHRIRSYFQDSREYTPKIRALISNIKNLDYIITNNEIEALVLECNLIKRYKPRYNVILRDDKNYPYIRLSLNEEYPRLYIVRRPKKDGSLYFGPFPKAYSVRETLRSINKIFPLRSCSNSNFRNRTRPCLNYQIGRCVGVCVNPMDKEKYMEIVNEVVLFLKGRNRELIDILKKKMKETAERLNYEEALKLRDRIRAIEKLMESQEMVSNKPIDQDIFALYKSGKESIIQTLFVREGKVVGGAPFSFSNLELNEEEILSSFIKQFYTEDRPIPDEIIISHAVEEEDLIEDFLREKRGKKVKIINPKRGNRLSLLNTAIKNAESIRKELNIEDRTLTELKEKLYLKQIPKIIECFDISNIKGELAVGSMVVFEHGEESKSKYRKFKIKTVNYPDDYAMMYEIIKRRYKRGKEERNFPNLLMVDGGRGQLNVALAVLKDLDIRDIDAIGLAKGERGRDIIYIPTSKNPISLKKGSKSLLLLQRIRDEAHRFALTYHRTLRKKRDKTSILDNIKGIGALRKRNLLKYFGSIDRIKKAGESELIKVPGITQKIAKEIATFLKSA